MKKISPEELYELLQNDTITLTEDIQVESKRLDLLKFFRSNSTKFIGTLEGNNYTIYDPPAPLFTTLSESAHIKNVTFEYTSPTKQRKPLFGDENYGVIENVTLNGSDLVQVTGCGFVKQNYNHIRDCTLETTVSTHRLDQSGGIVKENAGVINNCTIQQSKIYGRTKVGGIAGVNTGMNNESDGIKNCQVKNSKVIAGTEIGGITGVNTATVENCSVRESTVAKENTRTLNIWGRKLDLSSKTFTLTVVRKGRHLGDKIGGIAGINKNRVANCSVQNNTIDGVFGVGGVIGRNNGTVETVQDDSSTVSGKLYVGGISGINAGVIDTGLSTSTVEGEHVLGGLTGESTYGKIVSSISNVNLNLLQNTERPVGSLIGKLESSTITDCYHICQTSESLIGTEDNDSTVEQTEYKPNATESEIESLLLLTE